VCDNIQTAAGILDKVKPLAAQDASLLKNAKEQLLEGTKSIDSRQKLIRIADRLEYGWPVAEAYQKADELVAEEISPNRLEDAIKVVEQDRRKRKREEDCPQRVKPNQRGTTNEVPPSVSAYGKFWGTSTLPTCSPAATIPQSFYPQTPHTRSLFWLQSDRSS